MKLLHQAIDNFEHQHQLYSINAHNRPLVLLFSTWAGITTFEQAIAQKINTLGFDVLLIDLFSQQVTLDTIEQRSEAMIKLTSNQDQFNKHLLEFESFIEAKLGKNYPALITSGYCLGGLCSLLCGFIYQRAITSISFHALLKLPTNLIPKNPAIKFLIMNGYQDPMVSRNEVTSTQALLHRLDLDWTMVNFGNAMHSFALPDANTPENGVCFEEAAERRSWQLFKTFIQEH